MRPSRHFVVVSVGMVLALGHGATAYSQSAQDPTSVAKESPQSAVASSTQESDQSAVTKSVDADPQAAQLETSLEKFAAQPAGSRRTVLDINAIAPPLPPAIPDVKKSSAKPAAKAKSRLVRSAKAQPKVKTPRPVQPLPAAALIAQTPDSTTPATSPTLRGMPGASPMTLPSTTMPGVTPITSPIDSPGITPSKPIGPAKSGNAPDYLNPDPNPLSFPTKPDEVQVRGIQPITLLQAIDLAKQNNRDLQLAANQLERSRASVREQKAALYPSLGLQGGITHSRSASGQIQQETAQQLQAALPRNLRQGANSELSSTSFNSALQLTYNIYTGGSRPAAIRAAEQQLRSDELQYEVTLNALRLSVTSAYYDLQQADETVRIQQSAVRNAEASLKDTQALERAGLGTRFDVLQAQVQLANARQNLVNALGGIPGQSGQRIRRQQLAQLLAVPPTVELAAADPVEPAGSWDLSVEQSIALALKNRAELEQFLAQRELANQNRKLALSALMPTVAFTFNLNALDNLRDLVGFGYGYSAQLTYNWTFFDGGAARARAKQQEINMATAETRFAQQRETIVFDVQSAYVNLLSSSTNISTARLAVQQATEALRLARLRFQAGVGTQTEVINSENALTQQEGNLVTAILGYNRSLASLSRAVTNLPIPTGSTQPILPSQVPTSSSSTTAPTTPITPTTPAVPAPSPTPTP